MKWIQYIIIIFNVYVIGTYTYIIISEPKSYYAGLGLMLFATSFGLVVVLLDLILILYFWQVEQKLKQRTHLILLLLCISLPFYAYFDITYEPQILPIRIRNTTEYTLENFEVVARNSQHFQYNKLYPTESITFECECKHPDVKDTIGIELFYRIDGSKKRLIIPETGSGVSADTLNIQVLNKTASLVNGEVVDSYP